MSRVIVLGIIVAFASCASDDERPEITKSADSIEPADTADSMDTAEPVDAEAPPQRVPSEARSESSLSPSPSRAAERGPAEPQEAVFASISGERTNRCERLRMHIGEGGRRRYKRIRRPWTRADQQRFAQLVGLVAREMGADPRLIRVWAMRESSYRPHAMHVLNPDVEAATAAWRRLHYSAKEEAELMALMEQVGARNPRYWQAKARLHRVQTFRDNAYLDDVVVFEVVTSDGERSTGSEPAWAFGYGPFGFNPAYFVPVWDSRSPPWVFCEDDGLVAIITAVWAARTAQRECEAQGFGGSYASVNRRFSKGHCGPVAQHANFRARARRLGLDPDARAKLGRKWKRTQTDRDEILRSMRSKAVAAGLLFARIPPPGA